VQACPFCGTTIEPGAVVCPECLATLPTAPAKKKKRALELSDEVTQVEAPVLRQLEEEAPEHCAIHERARAQGRCASCGNPACAICLSHGGVCAACRRQAAPGAIAELSRDLGAFTGLAGLAHVGFAAWQHLDTTVLDLDPRRSVIAVVLGLAHLALTPAMWFRRRFGLAVACTGVVALGTLVPVLGGEPWFMALARLGLAAFLAVRTLALKRQYDELYLALDRPE
jgi:hypothetical protein